MREAIWQQLSWLVAMASVLAVGCSSQTATTAIDPPPSCSSPLPDGGFLPNLISPAHGSVTGSQIVATLCNGGAAAYLERTAATVTPPNKLLMIITSESVDPRRDFQIALPADATRLQLAATLGVSAAQPWGSRTFKAPLWPRGRRIRPIT
jgi:hypothetical protein